MDWIRILLTVVVIYLIFLVFTKFTKWIFKVVIVVLLLGVIVYGNLNYSELISGQEPLIDKVQLGHLIQENRGLGDEANLSLEKNVELLEENVNELNKTIENETLNETD